MAATLILATISFLTSITACILMMKYRKLVRTGTKTEGIVEAFENSISITDSTIKYPIIKFSTLSLKTIKGKASTSVFSWNYAIGEKVIIYYDSNNPSDFIIKSSNTILALTILLFSGVSLTALSVYLLI